jgi:hypothetical protein
LTSEDHSDIYFVKYNKYGDFVWAKNLPGKYDGLFGDRGEVIRSIDNDILLAGTYRGTIDVDPSSDSLVYNNVGTYLNSFLARYDLNGGLVWSRNISSPGSAYYSDVALDEENNLLVTGGFADSIIFEASGTVLVSQENTGEIFYAKFDGNGDLLFANSMGGEESESAERIRSYSNNDIFLAGLFQGLMDFDPGQAEVFVESLSIQDIFFGRYKNHLTAIDEVPNPDLLMQVYPNPASSIVYLKAIDESKSFSRVEICDASGQVLISDSFTLPRSFVSINVEGLTSGLYFISAFTGTGIAISKCIIDHSMRKSY